MLDRPPSLVGRTALVTGAGRGIGRHIALRLAGDGARVVLAARSRDALEATHEAIVADGGEATVVPTDLRDPAAVDALAAEVRDRFGPLDVLVSNSGVPGPTAELWTVDPADWEDCFRVNVTGVFLLCRAFLPGMIERKSGSVVVIGSASGKRPMHGRSPYTASKAALIGLVRTLATETGPHDIRVNLVSPGPVAGERLDHVIEKQAAAAGTSVAAARAKFLESAPLGRPTAPEDVADAVAYLAGDGSRSITGEDLNVSSGWVMY
jgi:NAD(P)-dependent dehydrogenase (short-subunit alcohol dehydrogenase family)